MAAASYTEMIAGMRKVFLTGKTKAYDWRIGQLNAMLRMLKDNEELCADALKKDLNKCAFESTVFELAIIYKDLVINIENLHDWMKPTQVKRDLMSIMDDCSIRPEPFGVALIISPWNYPIQLTFTSMIGAIAAGNCVVVKPSELAPASAEAITTLVKKYLDPECIRVVTGGIPETTQLLKERFDMIMYTGSTTVGRIVMEAAAKHLTPTILELGGKSPVFVDADCDFDVVANRIMWGKCMNSGQTCIAPDYVLCRKEIQDKLVESMKKSVLCFYGKDPKESDAYGRMINDRNFKRVQTLIEKSGHVTMGGNFDASQKYIAPTILTDVKLGDAIMQEEIFGPVIPILTVDGVEEAVKIINDGEKPLTMYVFSNNQKVVNYVMHNTSSGSFLSNDTMVMVSLLSLPFGGVGQSGTGSYHGKFSFDAFSHKRSVMLKSQGLEFINKLRYPPFTERAMKTIINYFMKTTPSKWWMSMIPYFVFGLALTALAVLIGTRNL